MSVMLYWMYKTA